MIIDSRNQQPAVNVFPNGGYYGGNGGGFGGDANGAWFWIIILFFFAIFGGWGNNGNNSGFNGGFVPYMMGGNYVQQGFDQAAVINGINGVQTAVSNGFANAEVSRCNAQANLLATLNNNQNANTAAMNGLAMALQNCCCENRAATADLKYTVATEACNDRAAVGDALQAVTAQSNANTQRILDVICQNTIDSKNEKVADLERQLTMANLAASQNAQTSTIQAGQRALANEVEQYVNPTAIPAYIVQNPNCCVQNYGCRQCQCG